MSEGFWGSSKSQTTYLSLEGASFIGLHHPESQSGGFVTLPPGLTEDAASAALQPLLERFRGDSAAAPGLLDAKMVCDESSAAVLRRLARKLGFRSWKECLVDTRHTQVCFYSNSGRLRVADETAPVAVSKVAPAAAAPVKASAARRTRVLIVDDSATIRALLTQIFKSDPAIEVVGAASLPSQVEGMIRELKPDVMTLDIHMPEMDGVTLLGKLLPKYQIPTVMITSISMEESRQVLEALSLGAVDYIQKPRMEDLDRIVPVIIEKVKGAALAKIASRKAAKAARLGELGAEALDQQFICIGSSTGGTSALREIFERMPAKIPPTVVVQHIPAVFSKALADSLNEASPFEVREARDGDEVVANQVLIAPGGLQMSLVRAGGKLKVKIEDAAPVNRHKPSVDVLFDSAAQLLGARAVGVILTGMGSDGARGLLKMRQAGARTIAQDQATSVVWGMPGEAVKLGAAEQVSALNDIPAQLLRMLEKKPRKAA